MRCLAEGRSKSPDEVCLRGVRHLGEGWNIQWLRVGPIDRVPGSQHPAVELLDGGGHVPIVPEVRGVGKGSYALSDEAAG